MSHYIEFNAKDEDDDIAKPPHPSMTGSQTSAAMAIATDKVVPTAPTLFDHP